MVRRSACSNRTHLSVNQLEARDVPAGNLTVALTGSTLQIQGDKFSHDLYVVVYDDRIKVGCRDTTTINGVRPPAGQLASVTLYGDENAISAINFEGNAGDDFIWVTSSGLTAERNLDITAQTFGGNDRVEVTGSLYGSFGNISGAVNINTGSGIDYVYIYGNQNVLLGVDLGAGKDMLRVHGSVAGVSNLDGGDGRDTLEAPADFYSAFANFAAGFETVTVV